MAHVQGVEIEEVIQSGKCISSTPRYIEYDHQKKVDAVFVNPCVRVTVANVCSHALGTKK